MKKSLTAAQQKELLEVLKSRFEKNMQRHKSLKWDDVEKKLSKQADKMWSLFEMEGTGGEPDVVGFDKKSGEFLFFDCSAETPKDRRSLCYDEEALNARKENKPKGSALQMAADMGIEVLNEEEYQFLQTLGKFDLKTSSWLKTADDMRKLDGAIFGDCRFGRVFIYHNGVQSYYAARAFRGVCRV
ncbi:MAG: DUF4256 domain-containing protein [Flavobacteriales bacterium]